MIFFSKSKSKINGVRIGDSGTDIYNGFKLDFGDEFRQLPKMWAGSNLSGEYSSSRPQILPRRINPNSNRMLYVDPHWRGGRSQSPVGLGYNPFSIEDDYLKITATPVPSESLEFLPTTYTQGGGDGSNRPMLFSGAIRTWPSYMFSAEGDFIYEGVIKIPSGVARGWWPSLWDSGLDWAYFGEVDLFEGKKDSSGNATTLMNIITSATSGGSVDNVTVSTPSLVNNRDIHFLVKKVGTTLSFYDDVATAGTLALRASTTTNVSRLKGAHDMRLELAVDNAWDGTTYNAADWPSSISYKWYRVWTPNGSPKPKRMNDLGQVNTTAGGSWSYTIPDNNTLFGSDFTPNIVHVTAIFDNTDTPGFLTSANLLPGGMTVNMSTRLVTGTVPATEGGRVGLLFTASSASGGAARRACVWFNVAPVNVSLFSNQTVAQGGAVNLSIAYTAFHSGNLGAHHYTVNKIGGSWLTITGNGTGAISITGTAPNSAQVVTLEVICTNGIGQTTTVTRTITVS